MAPIATYVFINVKADGLADEEPNINQLSMIAVPRRNLLKRPPPPNLYSKRNKLLLNDKQCEQLPLSKAFAMFMKPLKKPVCVVAFNGFTYHFPILKSKLTKLSLTPDFLCADAMAASYDILDPSPNKSKNANRLRGGFPWRRGRGRKSKLKYDLKSVFRRVFDDHYYGYIDEQEGANEAMIMIIARIADKFIKWVEVEGNNFEFARVPAAKKTTDRREETESDTDLDEDS